MKRKFMILALAVMGCGCVFAGYPVIDVANVIATVEGGYTMAQQLQAMYANIKNSVEQLDEMRKDFEPYEIKDMNMKDPLGSWNRIMTYGDRMKAYEENMESIINAKNLKIGNDTYSLADLYNYSSIKPENMNDFSGFTAIDPLSRKLSLEEQQIFISKYGKSYGNFLRVLTLEAKTGEIAAELTGYAESFAKNLKEDREVLARILDEVPGAGSIVKQAQVTNAQIAAQCQELKSQTMFLGKIGEAIASEAGRKETINKAMEEVKKNSNVDVADGYLKMLGKMGSRSDFMGHLFPIN